MILWLLKKMMLILLYEKRIHDHDFEIPDYLKVDPKNIILLEE